MFSYDEFMGDSSLQNNVRFSVAWLSFQFCRMCLEEEIGIYLKYKSLILQRGFFFSGTNTEEKCNKLQWWVTF